MIETSTETTWASVTGGQYLTPQTAGTDGSPLSWKQRTQLAAEVAELLPNLDANQCDRLISGVCTGLPVVLTFDTKIGRDTIERTRTVALVNYMTAPHKSNGQPGHVSITCPAMQFTLHLDRIVDVEYWAVFTERTYLDAA